MSRFPTWHVKTWHDKKCGCAVLRSMTWGIIFKKKVWLCSVRDTVNCSIFHNVLLAPQLQFLLHTHTYIWYDSLCIYIYVPKSKKQSIHLVSGEKWSLPLPVTYVRWLWKRSLAWPWDPWFHCATACHSSISRSKLWKAMYVRTTEYKKSMPNVYSGVYTLSTMGNMVGMYITANQTVCRIIWIRGTF